jgi:peptidoglycan/LPS O-acetylase OafA/YrhL
MIAAIDVGQLFELVWASALATIAVAICFSLLVGDGVRRPVGRLGPRVHRHCRVRDQRDHHQVTRRTSNAARVTAVTRRVTSATQRSRMG